MREERVEYANRPYGHVFGMRDFDKAPSQRELAARQRRRREFPAVSLTPSVFLLCKNPPPSMREADKAAADLSGRPQVAPTAHGENRRVQVSVRFKKSSRSISAPGAG